jgi:Cu/Ag efflux pump CusA
MAIAVIGGLITSTALTLVVVPVIYSLLDRFTSRRAVTEEEGETTAVHA